MERKIKQFSSTSPTHEARVYQKPTNELPPLPPPEPLPIPSPPKFEILSRRVEPRGSMNSEARVYQAPTNELPPLPPPEPSFPPPTDDYVPEDVEDSE